MINDSVEAVLPEADSQVVTESSGAERWDMLCAMPSRPHTLLDVGCGTGLDFISLRKKGTVVVGVDRNALPLEQARSNCTEVRLLDLDTEAWPSEWTGRFDVVAFADSLEHMYDPWKVLRDVRPLVETGGRVVVSLPNVRQWRTVVKLAMGRWDYDHAGYGTLAVGHIRFFTRRTILNLFTSSGYDNIKFYFQPRAHIGRSERIINAITFGKLSDLLYTTYTVSAEPSGHSEVITLSPSAPR